MLFRLAEHLAIDRLQRPVAFQPLRVDAIEMLAQLRAERPHLDLGRSEPRMLGEDVFEHALAGQLGFERGHRRTEIARMAHEQRGGRTADRGPDRPHLGEPMFARRRQIEHAAPRVGAVRLAHEPAFAHEARGELTHRRMRLPDRLRDLGDRAGAFDLCVAQHREPVRVEFDAGRAIGRVGEAVAVFAQRLEAAAEREFGLRLQEHRNIRQRLR